MVVYKAILANSKEKNPVETRLGFPMTSFLWAVAGGQAEISKYIMENESDIQNEEFVKAIHCAAVLGHFDVYSTLIQNVADKNPEGIGLRKTPLHLAAEEGHLAICKLIVTRVEEKNPQDIFQNTPLHYAAKSGHLEVSNKCYILQGELKLFS